MSTAVALSGLQLLTFSRAIRLLQSEADAEVLRYALATVLVVMGGGAVSALSPLVLKSLVDSVTSSLNTAVAARWPPAFPYGAGYLLLLFAGRVMADVRPLLNGAVDQRLHSRLTHRFFDHVLRLPMGYLIKHRSGELQHRLNLASAGSQLMVSHLAGTLLPVMVELVTMTIVLIHLGQPSLVAIFGIGALTYLAIFSTGASRIARMTRGVSASGLEMYAQLGEGVSHIETLRCFGAEEPARQRLRGASADLEQRWRHFHQINVGVALAASGTFAVSTAACLFIAMEAVSKHAMTIGGFVLTTVYALQMMRPLESLGAAARDLSRAVGYFQPLLELLAEPASEEAAGRLADAPLKQAAHKGASSVHIENLHFGYDADHPVLKGVDLHVPAGSMTAIVGRSGSGKSSLARLLMRLYTPQRGRILLDGRPIESIAAAELRGGLIGLVPQETALLHESIAKNIALGAPGASRDDILQAARGAHLETLVDPLGAGLDTPVGERGMRLSGGERQRVGIARAFLRRPGLYVLDEPTSMLDGKTEREIQKTLHALSAGATTIVIAHRLSTVVDADEIAVLDDGQIRERGSHRVLLARNGLYAQMWRQQMSGNP